MFSHCLTRVSIACNKGVLFAAFKILSLYLTFDNLAILCEVQVFFGFIFPVVLLSFLDVDVCLFPWIKDNFRHYFIWINFCSLLSLLPLDPCNIILVFLITVHKFLKLSALLKNSFFCVSRGWIPLSVCVCQNHCLLLNVALIIGPY